MVFDIRKVNLVKQEESTLKMDAPIEHDFGFTAMSEEEIRENEVILKKKIEEQTEALINSNKKHNNNLSKINALREMIMVFLNNLRKHDNDKEWLHWPDRVTQVNKFIEKMDALIENEQ